MGQHSDHHKADLRDRLMMDYFFEENMPEVSVSYFPIPQFADRIRPNSRIRWGA